MGRRVQKATLLVTAASTWQREYSALRVRESTDGAARCTAGWMRSRTTATRKKRDTRRRRSRCEPARRRSKHGARPVAGTARRALLKEETTHVCVHTDSAGK